MKRIYPRYPNHHVKMPCEGCNLKFREHGIIQFKGKYLCYACRLKYTTIIHQQDVGKILVLPKQEI
jgi:hypothetical protein